MNILFLTMSSEFDNIEARGIYTDLMRKYRDEGHESISFILTSEEMDALQRLRLKVWFIVLVLGRLM